MSFVLAHLSDVHLGPLPRVALRQLMSKRVTGYLNWYANRGDTLKSTTLNRVTEAVAECGADHVAVTGDLTNLALDTELRAAAAWLETLGNPADVSLVPGNHDAYVRGALDRAKLAWAPWMTGDDQSAVEFPYLRVRGPVAIVGVSSAIATPIFVAGGRFGATQAERLGEVLRRTGEDGLFRVVLIHHPPVRGATVPSKRLYGIGLFQRAVRAHGAELVLHGHTHKPQRHAIDGPDGTKVPVIGVPAAGQAHGHAMPPGAFNRFAIEGTGNAWHCTMQQLSATTETGPLELIEELPLSELADQMI